MTPTPRDTVSNSVELILHFKEGLDEFRVELLALLLNDEVSGLLVGVGPFVAALGG